MTLTYKNGTIDARISRQLLNSDKEEWKFETGKGKVEMRKRAKEIISGGK